VSSFSRTTILFVDDDPCMREVMAMVLNEEGYEVSTAADGLDALAQLRNSQPDLIISDLHMPRMSGMEFLSVLRWRFPAIPVIAISGALELSAGLPAGVMADAYYPKGRCHPDELMRTIHELMHKPLSRPTNYRPCEPAAIQNARTGFDASGRSVLLVTCADCLRVSALNAAGCFENGVLQAKCSHCHVPILFCLDIPQSSAPAIGAVHEQVRASAA
jgi:CheY-like chemotaxis protein